MPPRLRPATLQRMQELLGQRDEGEFQRGLFDAGQWAALAPRIEAMATWLGEHKPESIARADSSFDPARRFSQRDAVCIAYADHVKGPGDQPPAARLSRFFNRHLAGSYSLLHVLPHFECPVIHPGLVGPASRADGGFEPMNFEMDPRYGQPSDLSAVRARLMFDFVLNHLSASGEWFRGFLADDPRYRDFFMALSDGEVAHLDLGPVFRPRPHHPVIDHEGPTGTKRVWCTFSPTQVDLNVKNPEVFARLMEALVRAFVGQGASWIRLDAVGYLVKMLGLADREPSTSCFGLPETHAVLKAMRAFLADVAPSVTLVAEVNAPKQVIDAYYGDGDEAHVAYDFPAASRSLWSSYAEDASPMLEWARGRAAEPSRIGLAFTASHDGIGVLPMADVAPQPDGASPLDLLLSEVRRRGGEVNVKAKVVDGRRTVVPYEACITWTQAMLQPDERQALLSDELDPAGVDRVAARIVASQSYVLAGPHCVPADYLGALTGLLDDDATHARTAHHRDKNRGQVDEVWFEQALRAPTTSHQRLVSRMFARKQRLLTVRSQLEAFSPHGACEVGVVDSEFAGDRQPVFSVLRHPPEGVEAEPVLALTNASSRHCSVRVPRSVLGTSRLWDRVADVELGGRDDAVEVTLGPHQVAWLTRSKT